MLDLPVNYGTVYCGNCYRPTSVTEPVCRHCGREIGPKDSKGLLARIKEKLGIEISSDIVSMDLNDEDGFFNNREIDLLLSLDSVKVLKLEDVPDREAMFAPSRRIKKPTLKIKR